MSVLKVSNLTKKFHQFTAVHNVSFELKEGEILGLLGPNGAGETTTIQMLLGILTPTSGEIFYFGKPLNRYREEILESVNFSSTYTDFPWLLTVRENLSFFSYLYDIPDRKKRITRIIDIFNLDQLIDIKMQDLSAGQKTRVNLAKAFLNFPKILLLDEPTASLDPDAAQYMREFLLNQRKEFQVSIILTSHNMAEVEEVCDRVIFINKGRIIADDSPENLAQSIDISHVKLMIKDGLKRIIKHCEKIKVPFEIDSRYIIVDLPETAIADFLKSIMAEGIEYNEISIEKPTLTDYFLEVMKQKTK